MSNADTCPLCHSDLGHKINCPNGAAFTGQAIADMKSNADTRTLEQRVTNLALRMKPCPMCEGQGDFLPGTKAACGPCHGTGQVPEFPMLREVSAGNGWSHKQCIGLGGCDLIGFNRGDCQGRGWLSVTTTDGLLEAIEESGWNVAFTVIGAPPNRFIVSLRGRGEGPKSPIINGDWGKTRMEALVAALEAALGIEVK